MLKKVECKKSKRIFNSHGNVLLEVVLGFVVLTVVLYTLMQGYFLIHTQILMMNTCKVVLRNIEVHGGITSSDVIWNGVLGNLATSGNLDIYSINVLVNGEDLRSLGDEKWYPLRQEITVVLTANYRFISGVALGPNFEVPLKVKYVGSSQRLHKGDANFVPIIE